MKKSKLSLHTTLKIICISLCLALFAVLFSELTYAFEDNLKIYQVYYDPINTDNGGEAIELYNPSPENINISGLVIKTKTSSKDAVIPGDTFIKAGSYFLITDAGWDFNKDNKSWRTSDHEESLTLSNTEGGIALILKDEIIDAVGWGDINEEGLYENNPHTGVEEGKSLLRVKETNNNKDDFVSSAPDFLIREGAINEEEIIGINKFNTTTEVVLNSSSTIIVNINFAPNVVYPINLDSLIKDNKSKEDVIIKLLFDESNDYNDLNSKEKSTTKKEATNKEYNKKNSEKTSAILREVNHRPEYNPNEIVQIITLIENNGEDEIEAYAEHSFYSNERLVKVDKSSSVIIPPGKTERLHTQVSELPSGDYNIKTGVYYSKRYTDEIETKLTVLNENKITGSFVKIEKVKDIGFVVFLVLIIVIGIVLIKKYK